LSRSTTAIYPYESHFDGFSGVLLTEISLFLRMPIRCLASKKKTSINFWHLLLGDVQLGTLEIKNGMVQLIQKGNVKNFAAFLKKDNGQMKKEIMPLLLIELFRKH
jgi:hypothetical protein